MTATGHFLVSLDSPIWPELSSSKDAITGSDSGELAPRSRLCRTT